MMIKIFQNLLLSGLICCSTVSAKDQNISAARLLHHVKILSADSLQGRRTCSEGAERARQYILRQFDHAQLLPLFDNYRQKFTVKTRRFKCPDGINLVGYLKGYRAAAGTIVVSAHYDHLGVKNGQIYNGADDNASGVAALLELAYYFLKNKPHHNLVFCVFDAEELGSVGARAFLGDLPAICATIDLNFNIDMVSVSPKNELYIAGAFHYPFIKGLLEPVSQQEEQIKIRWGHDSPELQNQDWTFASDHGIFHKAHIPFVYFGVEDHQFYHKPTDTFEHIDQIFFVNAANFLLKSLIRIDAELGKTVR